MSFKHRSIGFERDGRPMSLIGTRIGHVLVTEAIGSGGMGEVFLGFDEKLERRVAVKTLRAERRLNPQAKARLLREARLLSKLDHPGLCRIYDLVEHEETDVLILELVEGSTLGEFIRDGVGENAALGVFSEVVEALAVAHGEGIIHRDLKPDNIMVTPEGHAKILDFGVARSIGPAVVRIVGADDSGAVGRARIDSDHRAGKDRTVSLAEDCERPESSSALTVGTREGSLVGTIAYMSPEQAGGGEITTASDLFSFGIMMQEMLTGRSAYGEASGTELMLRVFRAEVVAPVGISDEVATLIRDLITLDPTARPSAVETARRLKWIVETPVRRRRHRLRLAVAGLVAAILLAAAGIAVHSRWDAGRKAAMARRFAADAEDLEWRMRVEHLSPPHDLRPARQWIDARIRGIEEEVAVLGRPAVGPGSFAVGRGHMALGDYRAARSALDRSWASGFRGSEVSLALGMTYGNLYAEQLKALVGIRDPRVREYERARIERDLRDPALRFLSDGRDAGEMFRGYLEGLIALYEGRYDDVVESVGSTGNTAAWFYEPEHLIARAAVLQAQRLELHDQNFDSALERFDVAREHLLAASEIARSDLSIAILLNWIESRSSGALLRLGRAGEAAKRLDTLDRQLESMRLLDPEHPQLFRDQAGLLVDRARLAHSNGDDAAPLFAQAVAAADRAAEIDPDDPASFGLRGYVRQWEAWHLTQVGRDIRPISDAIIDDLRLFLERSDEQVGGLTKLAMAFYMRGVYETWYGGSPLPWVFEGIQTADKCLEEAPEMISCWEHLGSLTFLEGYYECRHGGDGEKAFGRSIAAYDKVVESSTGANTKGTLGFALYERGQCRMQRGRDPSPDLHRVLDLLAPIENPTPATHFSRGQAELGLARYARLSGTDPSPHLDRAVATYDLGVASDPNNIEAYSERADIHLERAMAASAEGHSPDPALAAARESVAMGLARNPSFPALHLRRGEIALAEARDGIRRGAPAEVRSALVAARAALGRARELHQDNAVVPLRLADLCYLEGQQANAARASVEEKVGEGLKWVDTSLAINSAEARALAARARLHLLLADASDNQSRRKAATAAARTALEAALEHNPLLSRELAPLRERLQAGLDGESQVEAHLGPEDLPGVQ